MPLQDQETSVVLGLLKQLAKLSERDSNIYPNGLFACQRYHPFLPYSREDDNIFFSLTVAYTLKHCLADLTQDEKEIATSLINGVVKPLPKFRNKDGKPTYNFWQTSPSRHFPNGYFMRHLEHFRIPDDADDSALAHLMVTHKEEERKELIRLLEVHSNGSRKWIRNTWPEFAKLGAISTFFGERMRIEFDVVVMCNTLLFLAEEDELESPLAKESLKYVVGVIERDKHLTDSFFAAPNYPTTELIIYHIARLMNHTTIESFERFRNKLFSQLDDLKTSDLAPLNLLVRDNAKMMLASKGNTSNGVAGRIEEYDTSMQDSIVNDNKGYFFHAGMLSAFENPLAQKLSQYSFFHLRYRCPALCLALLIENQVFRRRLNSGITDS